MTWHGAHHVPGGRRQLPHVEWSPGQESPEENEGCLRVCVWPEVRFGFWFMVSSVCHMLGRRPWYYFSPLVFAKAG